VVRLDRVAAITENYVDRGGRPLHPLERVRANYPVTLHGVALSSGSTDPLNRGYLRRLRTLVRRIEPASAGHVGGRMPRQRRGFDPRPV